MTLKAPIITLATGQAYVCEIYVHIWTKPTSPYIYPGDYNNFSEQFLSIPINPEKNVFVRLIQLEECRKDKYLGEGVLLDSLYREHWNVTIMQQKWRPSKNPRWIIVFSIYQPHIITPQCSDPGLHIHLPLTTFSPDKCGGPLQVTSQGLKVKDIKINTKVTFYN